MKMTFLAPANLEHGDIFGQLKVTRKMRSGRYQVACTCGYTKDKYTANALMRAGGVTKCSKCRKRARRA